MNPQEAAGLVETLEGEVNNGGFDQFFFNSPGDNTRETIEALEAIGAAATADLLKRAAIKFPGGMPPKDRFERQDVLLTISPDAEGFDDLDAEFYRCPDDLAGLLAAFKNTSGNPQSKPRSTP